LIDDLPQTLLICDSILYQEVYWRKNLYTTNEWTIFDRRIHDKMAIQKLLEEEPCNVGIPNVWSIPDWGAWFKAPRLEHPYKSDLWPPEIRDGNPLREWEDIDKLRE
jgi:hypothetical protein